MIDLFRAQTAAERTSFVQGFLAWVHERDGMPDAQTLTLSKREPRFLEQEANPIRWNGPAPVDPEAYNRDLERYVPQEATSPLGLWALITGKINRAERFGVEFGFWFNGHKHVSDQDPRTYQEFQELYHTRILADALSTLGLSLVHKAPSSVMRLLIRAMTLLPSPIANIIIMDAEIAGATIFKLLLEKARELMADQPEVLNRIEDLLGQILVDEVGHVHLMRSTLGPLQLRIAKGLLPQIAKSMVKDNPEISMLFTFDQVIARMVAADVDGLMADVRGELLPTIAEAAAERDAA